MNPLTIAGTEIRMDGDGRFCLNDLHRAAGRARKDQPNHFLARKETQDMVAELLSEQGSEGPPGIPGGPINVLNDGHNNGTYVVKELVYAYAMWISPKFSLQVIRAYDSMVMDELGRLNGLQCKAMRAELEFLKGMQEASRCGLALRRWQQSKPALEQTMEELLNELQPGLFRADH
tara:strand:+ start:24663 stop:25190 length:528 start_codon:yes stop_codon:yes gene_type:complete